MYKPKMETILREMEKLRPKSIIKYDGDTATIIEGGTCLTFMMEDQDTILIKQVNKCSYSGTDNLKHIEFVAKKLNIPYVKINLDDSHINYKGHNIQLGYLNILYKGESWYNSLGYFQKNYNQEHQIWVQLRKLTFIDIIKRYYQEHQNFSDIYLYDDLLMIKSFRGEDTDIMSSLEEDLLRYDENKEDIDKSVFDHIKYITDTWNRLFFPFRFETLNLYNIGSFIKNKLKTELNEDEVTIFEYIVNYCSFIIPYSRGNLVKEISNKYVHRLFIQFIREMLIELDLPSDYIDNYIDVFSSLDNQTLFWVGNWLQSPFFEEFNEELRNSDTITNDLYKQQINSLIYALDKLPPLPQDIFMYRGLFVNDNIFRKTKDGLINIDKGISSLTMSKCFADNWGDFTIKLRIPSGFRVIPVYLSVDYEFITYPGIIIKLSNKRDIGYVDTYMELLNKLHNLRLQNYYLEYTQKDSSEYTAIVKMIESTEDEIEVLGKRALNFELIDYVYDMYNLYKSTSEARHSRDVIKYENEEMEAQYLYREVEIRQSMIDLPTINDC